MAKKFQKLTAEGIKALKAGQSIHEHGIKATRLKNNDVRFAVKIMVDRQWIHRSLGLESEGVTRATCERFIEQSRTHAREDRLQLPKGRKTVRKFDEAANDYITRLREEGGKQIARKQQQLRDHLRPAFRMKAITKITLRDLNIYVNNRKAAGAAAATINRELAVMCHLLHCAAEWGWISKDCIPDIPRQQEPPTSRRALTDEQFQKLFAGAAADDDPDALLFVTVAAHTPMRHAEITSIRFENIHHEELRIHLPEAKAGARDQPITKELSRLLKEEMERRGVTEGWLFPSRRSRMGRRTYMYGPFRRSVERAGLKVTDVTPHVTRHTAVTKLAKKRVNVKTIMVVSGHKTMQAVMRYIHANDADVKAAAALLSPRIPSAPR